MDFWNWWIFQFFLNLPIFKNLPKIEYSSDFFERQQSWKLGCWGILYKRNYWKRFQNRRDMIFWKLCFFSIFALFLETSEKSIIFKKSYLRDFKSFFNNLFCKKYLRIPTFRIAVARWNPNYTRFLAKLWK